jgi:predicted porin
MKSKHITLAVASALSIPMSLQAAGSLTIYGDVGMALEHIDNDADSVLAVNSNHSALGLEGSMALANKLEAVFHYDLFVHLDAPDDGQFFGDGRDGWAGLRGPFGTVALGFQGRPWKTLSHALDPFEGTIADYSSIMGTVPGGTYFDGGIGHSIIWFGPNIEGFSWHAQYGAEEGSDGPNNMGLQIHYSDDRFFAGLSYDSNGKEGFPVPNAKNETALKLVGSIKIANDFTFTGAWESIAAAGGVDNADRDAFWLAGSYQMGDTRFSLAYALADDINGVPDSGADQISLGVFHGLGRNTTIYGIYTRISNDSNGNYEFIRAPHTSCCDNHAGPATGDNHSAIAVGIKYSFSADLL